MSDITTLMMGAAGAGGDYQISRSLRFNSADSAYLSRTPASAGNRKTWTYSVWVKRSALGATGSTFGITAKDSAGGEPRTEMMFINDTIRIGFNPTGSAWSESFTTAVFRDVSAWYHIVVSVDMTQATGTNRLKLYVNGVQQTFGTYAIPSQNTDLPINNTIPHAIGRYEHTANLYFNGYLAEVHFVDGQALTPSDFGETDATTGVWKPKAYTGTYGTNGFYLDFSDNSSTTALGYDAAGSNDWTVNNFSVTAGAGNDSLVDSPTQYGTDTGAGGEVRGNYATFNPLQTTATLSDGNLQAVCASGAYRPAFSTIGVSSGKWYCEFVVTAASGTYFGSVGIAKTPLSTTTFLGSSTMTSYAYEGDGGQKVNNGSYTAYGATWTTNDVIGVALDLDAGTLVFYKNGVSQGTAFTGLSGEFFFGVSQQADTDAQTYVANFGQRPFAYTAPSGFKALCTTNLPDPTVVQGDDYFNTVLYTGTGSSLGVTGVGFQPDFVWIKERSGAADHALYDAVRGVQQQLESNTTTDETTESTGLTAFGTNGFTVGSLAQVNTSTDTYVAWNWKESTVSKFDIVTYTGNGTARTISHNLGVVPNMIIVKARTTASTDQGWPVYHSANTANPETDYLLLNSTAATADLDTVWNDTAPTSSVFSVGTNALVNANNDTYVAYLFANVAGYSAFGSYTGNGSTDGPFIYTGFRPAWILIKQTSASGEGWSIYDNSRPGYNITQDLLYADASSAETTGGNRGGDFVSNGFKIRTTGASYNSSGSTYIYAAFAENPFKYSLGR